MAEKIISVQSTLLGICKIRTLSDFRRKNALVRWHLPPKTPEILIKSLNDTSFMCHQIQMYPESWSNAPAKLLVSWHECFYFVKLISCLYRRWQKGGQGDFSHLPRKHFVIQNAYLAKSKKRIPNTFNA